MSTATTDNTEQANRMLALLMGTLAPADTGQDEGDQLVKESRHSVGNMQDRLLAQHEQQGHQFNANIQNASPSFLKHALQSIAGNAANQWVSNQIDNADKQDQYKTKLTQQYQDQQSLNANLENLRKTHPEYSKAIDLLQVGSKDLSQAAGNIVEQQSKPKGQINPWVGGVKGNPLQRQNYTTDEQGQPVALGEPYAAFQAPETWKPPILTTAESHPGHKPNTVIQESTRGKRNIISTPEDQFEIQTLSNGDKVQTNLTTNKVDIIPAQRPTQDQLAAQGYANQMSLASKNAEHLMEAGTPVNEKPDAPVKKYEPWNMSAVEATAMEMANYDNPLIARTANAALSAQSQAYLQQMTQWGMGVKRLESGAAVSRKEGYDYATTFWPQFQDKSPEARQQKYEARMQKERDVSLRAQGKLEPMLDQQQQPESQPNPNNPALYLEAGAPIGSPVHTPDGKTHYFSGITRNGDAMFKGSPPQGNHNPMSMTQPSRSAREEAMKRGLIQ